MSSSGDGRQLEYWLEIFRGVENEVQDEIRNQPIAERVKSWWRDCGNQLARSFKEGSSRKPNFFALLAITTRDLRFAGEENQHYYETSEEFARILPDEAKQYPSAYELAKHICIRNLALKKLPPELQPLAAMFMAGKIKKPPKGKGERSDNWFRNLLIVKAIEVAEIYSLKPTQNDASSRRQSGCALVAEALEKAGCAISYDAVRKVWDNRQSSQEVDNTIQLSRLISNNDDEQTDP